MTDKDCIRIKRKYYRPLKPIPSDYQPLLKELPNIGVVIFDIYGTLLIADNRLNSADLSAAGNNPDAGETWKNLAGMIRKYSLEYTPYELTAKLEAEAGQAYRNRLAEDTPYPEIDITGVWKGMLHTTNNELAERIAFEFEMIMNRVHPAGNLKALFGYLKSRKIRCGILSNAQFYTEKILACFVGRGPWTRALDPGLIFYSYRYGIAKPAPGLFARVLAAVKSAGFAAENVLCIGNDPENDIAPAAGTGFKTALFAGDARCTRDAAYNQAQPDLVITDWKQIKRIIR